MTEPEVQYVKRKTLEDLPQIVVKVMRSGVVSDNGYKSFELEATFDPILEHLFEEMLEGDVVQWFWLLFGHRDSLTPVLKSFDKNTKTAILICHEKEESPLVGAALAYLSPYWQAYHVWMVIDPNWGWERRPFQGIDAVAEDYVAKEASIVNGREVKIWTKLEPIGIETGQSRHYPARDQVFPVQTGTRLVPGGWGHAHCELCHSHIDPGIVGYCDPGERWMCEKCYERYVSRRDLAFVDEL